MGPNWKCQKIGEVCSWSQPSRRQSFWRRHQCERSSVHQVCRVESGWWISDETWSFVHTGVWHIDLTGLSVDTGHSQAWCLGLAISSENWNKAVWPGSKRTKELPLDLYDLLRSIWNPYPVSPDLRCAGILLHRSRLEQWWFTWCPPSSSCCWCCRLLWMLLLLLQARHMRSAGRRWCLLYCGLRVGCLQSERFRRVYAARDPSFCVWISVDRSPHHWWFVECQWIETICLSKSSSWCFIPSGIIKFRTCFAVQTDNKKLTCKE